MMYFTPLKTAVILGLCLLGAILCIPNLFPAPVAWLPWRQVHLGLDLRGGSYLLLEVDMKSVVKERLDGMVDGIRQALRPGAIFYQTLEAQPDQNRILLRLRDATKLDAAQAAIRPLISAEGPTNTPEFDMAATPDGTIVLTLSPVALNARARGAVQQSIEIVRRRIDETGVVDPQITQQGDSRIVVQLPGISDPNRIKELLGKTAHMTFQLVDEYRQCQRRRPAAARRSSSCRCRTTPARRSRCASGWTWTAATSPTPAPAPISRPASGWSTSPSTPSAHGASPT